MDVYPHKTAIEHGIYAFLYIAIHSDINIHVASQRQPPAPHRWAAARNCQ